MSSTRLRLVRYPLPRTWSLDLPLATHEHPDSTTLSVTVLEELRSDGTTDEFAEESDRTEQNNVTPYFPGVEKAEIRRQTREDEILRHSQRIAYERIR